MKTLSISTLITLLAVVPAVAAPVLVAQWDNFSGLTAEMPLPADRGQSLLANTWRLNLNGGAVNPDGSLSTGTEAPPMIVFNGNSHNIGGYQLGGNNNAGGYTILMTIRPGTFNTTSPRPIWSVLTGTALTYDQIGIVCTQSTGSSFGIRGVWSDVIWGNANNVEQTFGLSAETSELTLRSAATSAGLFTSVNGSESLGWGGLTSSTYTGTAIALGNFAGSATDGNDFIITRLAVYQTGRDDTDVTFDETIPTAYSATLSSGSVTDWEAIVWNGGAAWVDSTLETPIEAELTLNGDATLIVSTPLVFNRLTVTGSGTLTVQYAFSEDQLSQISPVNPTVYATPFNRPLAATGSADIEFGMLPTPGYVGGVTFNAGNPVFSATLVSTETYSRALLPGAQDWFAPGTWVLDGTAVSYPESNEEMIRASALIETSADSTLTANRSLAALEIDFSGTGPFTFAASNTLTAGDIAFTNVTGAVTAAIPVASVTRIHTTSETEIVAIDTADVTTFPAFPGPLQTFTKEGSGTTTVPDTFTPGLIRVKEGTLRKTSSAAFTHATPVLIESGAIFDLNGTGAKTIDQPSLISGSGTLRLSGTGFIFLTPAIGESVIAEGHLPDLELNMAPSTDTNALVLGNAYIDTQMNIGNLRGTGVIRGDSGLPNTPRTLAAHLTEDCTFSGLFKLLGNRHVNLTVASADPENIKTLTLAGSGSNTSTLTVKSFGSVVVSGTWSGPFVLEEGGRIASSGGQPTITSNGGIHVPRVGPGLTPVRFQSLSGSGITVLFEVVDGVIAAPAVSFETETSTPVRIKLDGIENLPRGSYTLIAKSVVPLNVSLLSGTAIWRLTESLNATEDGYIYTLEPHAGTFITLY